MSNVELLFSSHGSERAIANPNLEEERVFFKILFGGELV